uniref:Uncharacterized protein n=1 Tax=Arundo donax TaxID=35708 RepID=A0A0A8ZUR0_ARUDO
MQLEHCRRVTVINSSFQGGGTL